MADRSVDSPALGRTRPHLSARDPKIALVAVLPSIYALFVASALSLIACAMGLLLLDLFSPLRINFLEKAAFSSSLDGGALTYGVLLLGLVGELNLWGPRTWLLQACPVARRLYNRPSVCGQGDSSDPVCAAFQPSANLLRQAKPTGTLPQVGPRLVFARAGSACLKNALGRGAFVRGGNPP